MWVSCEGENPADIENIGPIEYYPRQGFPGYYYPYENSEGYLSPLVAIHFTRPVRKYRNIRQDKHILTENSGGSLFGLSQIYPLRLKLHIFMDIV